MNNTIFALLDDSNATLSNPTSRLYTGFIHQYICTDPQTLNQICEAVNTDIQAGLFAVILADYEWGAHLVLQKNNQENQKSIIKELWEWNKSVDNFDSSSQKTFHKNPQENPEHNFQNKAQTPFKNFPALRFFLFNSLEKISVEQADSWLLKQENLSKKQYSKNNVDSFNKAQHQNKLKILESKKPNIAGIANLTFSVSQKEFNDAMHLIHHALLEGDCYQINYTFRLLGQIFGEPLAFYRRLRQSQPTRYGALIGGGGIDWIMSCSPELFISNQKNQLIVKPMKGTASREDVIQKNKSGNDELKEIEDNKIAQKLEADEKNRAENMMIVDLLRNDLSQIAKVGSVKVKQLFATEKLPSVWQMTSTIEAQLSPTKNFADVLRALFPCGSITGAPKQSAIQLINQLENTARGIYTGAIGWLDAATQPNTLGDFCLSVAIRTLTVNAQVNDKGLRNAQLGIGAGIVFDSNATEEYKECISKAKFLLNLEPGFSLLETMYATREESVRFFDLHLARLKLSAQHFLFNYDETEIRKKISICVATFLPKTSYRLKLILSKNGHIDLIYDPLKALTQNPVSILCAWQHSFDFIDSRQHLLSFKTTDRAIYDHAIQIAEEKNAFDMVFCNEKDELTEGARSNIFIKKSGQWLTSPLSSGVLPGIMRSVLMRDPKLSIKEVILKKEDLNDAEEIMVCNALRGVLPACIIKSR